MADADVHRAAAVGQPKKRALRKFSFRGVDLDALLDMSTNELVKLFSARARRRFQRGLKWKPMALIEKLRKAAIKHDILTRGLPSQSLSGTLSPAIGNLTDLQSVLLQNNAISRPIPVDIGNLEKLHTLDLSNNEFSGSIPSSLGDLKNLNYLRLNNNSLSGPCPDSLSNINGLTLVDLSYNNLTGSLPKISARTFNIMGNPLMCGLNSGKNCSSVSLDPLSFPPDNLKTQSQAGVSKAQWVAIAFGASVGFVTLVIISVALLL